MPKQQGGKRGLAGGMLRSPRLPHASLHATHSRSRSPPASSSYLATPLLPAPFFRTNSNLPLPTARRTFPSLRHAMAMQPPPSGDDTREADALLPRGDSAGRRRSSPVQSASPRSPGSASAGPRRQSSFRHDVGHAASETYLVTRLTFSLLQYLGLGYRWMRQLFALAVYAILLMPGFLQVGYYYFFSSQVRRSIVYGEQPRNRLDLYIPKDNRRPCPVVAFVTGGAWIIGYKAWGALLGRRLAERGIMVACIDYRNFPQGTISDMVSDASQGISFVCNNIASYGGDPNQIYLMGQSAGAHISACVLMDQAVKESSGQPISWSVTQIKAYFGLSGGYNLHNLVDHFHQRGLNRSIFFSIMDGEESLPRYSPEIVVKESSARTIALLPRIFLMHGTDDYSIPSSARHYCFFLTSQRRAYAGLNHILLALSVILIYSIQFRRTFVDVLQQAGAQAKLLLYEGKTHTDIFIQDPLRGGRDPLVEDVLSIIHADDATRGNTASVPTPRRLVFEWQLQLARWVSPF